MKRSARSSTSSWGTGELSERKLAGIGLRAEMSADRPVDSTTRCAPPPNALKHPRKKGTSPGDDGPHRDIDDALAFARAPTENPAPSPRGAKEGPTKRYDGSKVSPTGLEVTRGEDEVQRLTVRERVPEPSASDAVRPLEAPGDAEEHEHVREPSGEQPDDAAPEHGEPVRVAGAEGERRHGADGRAGR